MLIDLHTHTKPRSWDSFIPPDEMVDLAKQSGLDAVVFAEHDWAWEQEEIDQLAKSHEFKVFRAMEINTEDGHILVIGLHENRFGMHRSNELAQMVKEVNGLMISAHPYRRQMPWKPEDKDEYENALSKALNNPAYQYISGIEVLNGRGKIEENTFSLNVQNRMHLPATASSDTHQFDDKEQHMGRAATYFEADINNEEELIYALRSGRFWPLDLTKGELTSDTDYYDIPSDIEKRWSFLSEQRKQLMQS